MAKEIRKDPFEEFLKKSLASHEEPPPADMWARIERQLHAMPASGTALLLRRAAIAATIVLGLIAWQFMRYDRRIQQLESLLRQQHDTLALLQQQWHRGPHAQKARTPAPTPPTQTTRPSRLPAKKASLSTSPARPHAHTPPAAKTATAKKPTHIAPGTHLSHRQARPAPPQRLEAMNYRLDAMPRPPLTGKALPPPVILRPTRRSAASGPSWTALHTTRKIKKDVGAHAAGPQKEFTDTSTITSREILLGLWSEIPLERRLQLQTGLLYRVRHTTLRHQPTFRYSEGQPLDPFPHSGNNPHGHHAHYKQFFYTLNTASGAISLRLALEAQDTTQPIAPDEQIGLDIRARQQTSYLTLPLALQYRRAFGRWSLAGSAGVWANVLVDLRTSLEEAQSMHPLFLPDKATFALQYPYLRDLYLEWTAGLRIEWQPTPALRLALGPTCAGLLTPPHKAPYIRTAGASIGWSATLQYLF